MRKLLLFILLLAWLALLISRLAQHTKLPPMWEMPARLRPGEAPPPCYMSSPLYYPYDTYYCVIRVEDREIYIAHSLKENSIIRASYSDDMAIGDLIGYWGAPIGADVGPWSAELVWPGRVVWVFGANFSPFSHRLYIIYTAKTPQRGRWAGFTNH